MALEATSRDIAALRMARKAHVRGSGRATALEPRRFNGEARRGTEG